MDHQKAAHAAEILKAAGHPVRIRILATLGTQEENVGAIAQRLELSQPIVSQQLRILRMAGLVTGTRVGSHRVYRLSIPQVRNLIACVEACCEG